MDQQNIDRLFREKLDQMEVSPSANSWSQVEGQIRRKKKPVVYWVAASISLLLLSWTVWPGKSENESLTPIASEVSHPLQSDSYPEFVLPTFKKEVKKEPDRDLDGLARKEASQFASKKETISIPKDVRESVKMNKVPEPKTMVAKTEIVKPEVLQPEIQIDNEALKEESKPILKTVKITYIASNTKPKQEETIKSDTSGVFKKVIAFAGKIDPGEMLADMKTAKDNLLNGGLKNKKERSSL